MTRDEALEILRDFIGWKDGTTVGIRHDVLEALAALSSPCACGGKEPLAVVKAHVSEYLGPNYHLDCHFGGPAGLGEGHTWPKWFPVRVLVFTLPAEEKP